MNTYMFKVLVIGAAGTGKTSSIRRFVNDEFADNYQATIGVDFAVKTIQYDDDIVVKLQLWDIAGQERYSSMTRVYFKEATGALLVYDMTNPDSFDAIQRWKSDLDSKVTLPDSLGGGSIPAVLLANKSDLTPATQGLPPQQSTRQLDQYCTENGYLDWFPTSAKENTNLDEAARCLEPDQ
ncbi:P-loop containing nucleoside triphosphate hydrolase protein [Dimargaris cristalligena]|uniref:Ras-related protein Rab n=1 Tax=Dimargaris cristalligena TaxID=215637 RepID=A0A4Q0A357_9FUNG|nr:P-loop containing nucleoside triphosphate hydrolase protein [Dimargaris cristalligena]|eukprot:RKP40298.1 P-loop containing nucleoside triphosphate hydrolase protein [Dimargaris cristalligena]